MRLWHQSLIPVLPRQQLLGQHRECCALRGLSWGQKHSTIQYIFNHPFSQLVSYHFLVIQEMKNRGYNPNKTWSDPLYRGKRHEPDPGETWGSGTETKPYPEHSGDYLRLCIDNLAGKLRKAEKTNKYNPIEIEKFFAFVKFNGGL